MSYIIRVDQETGKYIVRSTDYPDLKTTADCFYDAVEQLEWIRARQLDTCTKSPNLVHLCTLNVGWLEILGKESTGIY